MQMSNDMKFGWKEYWKPTPMLVRQLADSVFITATTFGSAINLDNHPQIGTAVIMIGFFAKVVSNFFSDEKPIQ